MKFKIIFLTYIIFLFNIFFTGVNSIAAQRLIPKIEKIDPYYGAVDIDTRSSVKITFNSVMDKKSVERNFNIYPGIKGDLRWAKNTLVFSPEKPFLPSTSYFVSFNPEIRSVNGIPFPVTYFSTPAEGVFVGPDDTIKIVSINGDVKELSVVGKNPVWTNDNKSILYDFDGAIWKVDADGKNRKKISYDDETYSATRPICNPLSNLVAFVGTNSAGSANVYVIDLETEILQQLTVFYEPSEINHLSWSPDGLYLAFLRAGQIWIMNQDGKDLKKLTTDELPCKGNFSWSPGGTKIAFTGPENVWIGDIYSSKLRKMSFDDPETGILDWSQDNKLVFVSDGLTIMNADGSEEIKIKSAAQHPSWINSADLISFVLPLDKQKPSAQLWVMDSTGKNKKKITEISFENNNVSWSRNIGYWNLFSP